MRQNDLARFTPILMENTVGVVRGLPPLFPFHPTLRDDLWLDGYLNYPHAAKALYIYKHPCLLPGFEPSPNGTAVSVINQYTGWAI
ncbi:hypothetical protein TNCV_3474241 [Trichonephila clavipes]|nr:hypothetical protein TNCV_3474241 [Trichonephila clavipes]